MTAKMDSRRRQRGFTLLEILIAVTILAIAVIAGLKAIEANTNNVGYLKLRTMAHWVGLNQVAELQLQNSAERWPTAALSQEGTVTMAGLEWKWKSEGKQFSKDIDDFYQLTISISLAEAPEQVLSQHVAYLVKRL